MGDDDYRFTYEHYRVPVLNADLVPVSMGSDLGLNKGGMGYLGTHQGIEDCSFRYDDAYRAEFLLPVELRENGKSPYRPGYEPHTHGGKTICRVWWNENLLASATSWCSINDPFSYRVGRHISRGRALANLASLQEVAIG